MFLILVMRFYSSAAAHDDSLMITVHGEDADQSHPQNTQQRMLKIKESISKKKQRILYSAKVKSIKANKSVKKKKAVVKRRKA